MARYAEGASSAPTVFVRQATGLVRELSWFDTFIMVLGLMSIPALTHQIVSLLMIRLIM